MPLVLDASVASSWAFSDENQPHADLVLSRMHSDEAVVPALWWFEIRNTLIVNERRKRISKADTTQFLERLSRLSIRLDRIPNEAEVLRLARTHRLSVYDAAYLELAERELLPLATLDSDLAKAA